MGASGRFEQLYDYVAECPRLYGGIPIRTVAKPRFSIIGRPEHLRFALQAWIWPPCDGQLQASHHHYDGGRLIGASPNPSNDPEQGGRHWVLHARCPYPHTKSVVRILHKPLMQLSVVMRPATVPVWAPMTTGIWYVGKRECPLVYGPPRGSIAGKGNIHSHAGGQNDNPKDESSPRSIPAVWGDPPYAGMHTVA